MQVGWCKWVVLIFAPVLTSKVFILFYFQVLKFGRIFQNFRNFLRIYTEKKKFNQKVSIVQKFVPPSPQKCC
jgi:hypothetical protein